MSSTPSPMRVIGRLEPPAFRAEDFPGFTEAQIIAGLTVPAVLLTEAEIEAAATDGGEAMRRYTVPGIFWRDHYDRCGDEEGQRREVIADKGRVVIVELNAEALDDLRSDANHYGNGGLDFAGEMAAYRPLIRSAQATLRAIERQSGCTP